MKSRKKVREYYIVLPSRYLEFVFIFRVLHATTYLSKLYLRFFSKEKLKILKPHISKVLLGSFISVTFELSTLRESFEDDSASDIKNKLSIIHEQ